MCLTNELTSYAHTLSTPPCLLHRVYSHFCVCDASLPACLQNQILCLLLGQSSSRACGCISKGTEHYGFSCGLLQLHIQAFIRCCVSGGNKVTPYLQLVWGVLELGSVQGAPRKASANPLVLLEQKDPWLLVWGQSLFQSKTRPPLNKTPLGFVFDLQCWCLQIHLGFSYV